MSQFLYYGQIVVGPAGSGKSTYCQVIQEYAGDLHRKVWVINLDPAAESFEYKCDFDIRDLISVDDVMEELKLGPNGALVYCMEYLLQNMDWLDEIISDFCQDDYILFDCPGQIELFCHYDIMTKLAKKLQQMGFSICAIYLIDVTVCSDQKKFNSSILTSLSTIINFEIPNLTVLTKCDLIGEIKQLKQYVKNSLGTQDNDDFEELTIKGISLEKDGQDNQEEKTISKLDQKYQNLDNTILNLIREYSLINTHYLNLNEYESVQNLIFIADNMIQYGENLEPNEGEYEDAEQAFKDDYIKE